MSSAMPAGWGAAPRIHPPAPAEVFEFNGWRLCPTRFELLSPDGAVVGISATEVRLLTALVRHPGRVFTRSWLQEFAGGPSGILCDRALNSRMTRLRRRLRRPGSDASSLIRAARQEGYFFAGAVRRLDSK